jgi:hypothetical protein
MPIDITNEGWWKIAKSNQEKWNTPPEDLAKDKALYEQQLDDLPPGIRNKVLFYLNNQLPDDIELGLCYMMDIVHYLHGGSE